MEQSPVPNPAPGRPRSLFRQLKLKDWKMEQSSESSGVPGRSPVSPVSGGPSVPVLKDRQVDHHARSPIDTPDSHTSNAHRHDHSNPSQVTTDRSAKDGHDILINKVKRCPPPVSDVRNNMSIYQTGQADEHASLPQRHISCHTPQIFGAPMELPRQNSKHVSEREYSIHEHQHQHQQRHQPHEHQQPQKLANNYFSSVDSHQFHDQKHDKQRNEPMDFQNYNNVKAQQNCRTAPAIGQNQDTRHAPAIAKNQFFQASNYSDTLARSYPEKIVDPNFCRPASVAPSPTRLNGLAFSNMVPGVYQNSCTARENVTNEPTSMKDVLRARIMGTQSTVSAPSTVGADVQSFESFTEHLINSKSANSVDSQNVCHATRHPIAEHSKNSSGTSSEEFEKFMNNLMNKVQPASHTSQERSAVNSQCIQRQHEAKVSKCRLPNEGMNNTYNGANTGGLVEKSNYELSMDSSNVTGGPLNNMYLMPVVFKQEMNNALSSTALALLKTPNGMVISQMTSMPTANIPDGRRNPTENHQDQCLNGYRIATVMPDASLKYGQPTPLSPPSQDNLQNSHRDPIIKQTSYGFLPSQNTSFVGGMASARVDDSNLNERNANERNSGNQNVKVPTTFFTEPAEYVRPSRDIVFTRVEAGAIDSIPLNDKNAPRLYSPPSVTASGQLELDRRAITEGLLSCEICEDRATGLHYGIVTCEGCKGFFKRTVQNRKVYRCSGNESCIVSRSCRNRCQYCRFKKCLQKGMVVAAVRQDRMPGGRNSGAVYDMYKVKYKKHRRRCRNKAYHDDRGSQHSKSTSSDITNLSEQLENLSSRAKVSQQWLDDLQKYTPGARQEKMDDTPVRDLDNIRNASDGKVLHKEFLLSKQCSGVVRPESIQRIIDCEYFQDIVKFAYRVEYELNASRVLGTLGDDIVYHLIRWAQNLPFQSSIPMPVYFHILTNKWHEVLFLTTTAYQTVLNNSKDVNNKGQRNSCVTPEDLNRTVEKHIQRLSVFMTKRLHKKTSLNLLREEVRDTMEKVVLVIHQFSVLNVTIEEYVCLKIILLLNTGGNEQTDATTRIQEEYMDILQDFVTARFPQSPNRLGELMLLLPQIQSAAALLLQSRMIFIPFLLSNLAKEYRPNPGRGLFNPPPSFSSSSSSSEASSLVKPQRLKRYTEEKLNPQNMESGYSTENEMTNL